MFSSGVLMPVHYEVEGEVDALALRCFNFVCSCFSAKRLNEFAFKEDEVVSYALCSGRYIKNFMRGVNK